MTPPAARLIGGPYDGRELPNRFSSPAIIRCSGGAYRHNLRAATYRWYPDPIRLDRLACETEVSAIDLFGFPSFDGES